MTARIRHVPEQTLANQKRASDPSRSAWVSANAGSGKTHVLSQRVVRLLLDGVDPSRILCLTYTRAAAANMSNRVFRDLARWTLLDEPSLTGEIAALTGKTPGPRRVESARRLFARALETPGGLKVQTIHAFCEAVLHQFPLEANIAGHFELLDNQMEAALVAEARRHLIDGASGGENPALAAAFADVLARVGENGLDGLLAEIVSNRNGLRQFIDRVAVDEPPYAALYEEFGFPPGVTADEIADAAWPLPGFDAGFFEELDEVATSAGAKRLMEGMLPPLRTAFAELDPLRRLRAAERGLLTAKGEPYAASIFTKAAQARLPDVLSRYEQAASVLIAACDRLALLEMVSATRSALTIADWLIARYEQLKSGRGFLDFNDLITRTAALLSRADAGAWVHYKLDRGIDHILLDEAQDTSPEQWAVVKKLASEFFVGQGARDGVTRTIFAVGDEKQSIYSFQGAEPQAFSLSKGEFHRHVTGIDAAFEDVRLTQSFRSTGDVLSAVDLVFSDEDAARGLSYERLPVQHDWIREGDPGYVELWCSLGPETVEAPEDWTEAIDHASAPATRLAEIIADTIAEWVNNRRMLEGKGRPVRPGDVMVLVRKRDSFVHALSRALKQEGRKIAVAGADRLLLTDHIAVKDLLAIARFALQPHDDLSLAAVLKSPVFGMSEERLFALAQPRRDRQALFDALKEQAADGDTAVAEIAATLEEWRNQAAFRPVFEFFAGILAGTPARAGVRSRMIARLGQDAGDILDEFLSFALAAERAGGDGLEAFVATLDNAAPEIKREMDQGRDQVRIMTVHASKGLEAPIVFLVDPGSAPFAAQHQPRLARFHPEKGGWQGEGFLWRADGDTKNGFSRRLEDAVRERAEEEYRRLLYVGMTRAEDRLIVCGYHGAKGPRADTWHAMVARALSASDRVEEQDGPDPCRPVLRYRINPPAPVESAGREDGEARGLPEFPAPLRLPLPPPPKLPRPLSPSGASVAIEMENPVGPGAASPVLGPAGTGSSFAMARGSALHKLLQVLPDLALPAREEAAQRYLALAGADWEDGERRSVLDASLRVLAEPGFSAVFGPGSRAEVAVMGTLQFGQAPRAISGKIDRVAVSDRDVLIVDYKTNRSVPVSAENVQAEYVLQLALYRALLSQIYPGHEVRAALLYTEAPKLVELPVELMERALARFKDA